MNIQRQTRLVTLVAVPCILGVNLTGKDLMEFIQQLDETDGSSAMPPAAWFSWRCLGNKTLPLFWAKASPSPPRRLGGGDSPRLALPP
ncbi:hypothetical protein GQ55_8G163900 [Panicum hallii var. hallii]|uniref:Uncharacterized protein n=1 Tax=Panicum hallii var. hallii TaxID=1504633 RepID=A0A2T7CNC0_9POAL|nr:hypothetical protein GQ55_8G163900 [Panicum hallii var. hallii]